MKGVSGNRKQISVHKQSRTDRLESTIKVHWSGRKQVSYYMSANISLTTKDVIYDQCEIFDQTTVNCTAD